MRRILRDQGTPIGLRVAVTGFQVHTALQMGWDRLANGDLLAAAERDGFAIVITTDQRIQYQQNLASRKIALVVLETNRWETIRGDIARVQAAVDAAGVGSYVSVPFPRPALLRRPWLPDYKS